MQTSFLAANATNATVTMRSSGLTVPVSLGRKYEFWAELRMSTDVEADGYKVDFDTSAAATDFRVGGIEIRPNSDPTVFGQAQATALATVIQAALDASPTLILSGSYEPSASGNLLIRFAQQSHSTGTLTLLRGSCLVLLDMT